LPIDYGPFGMPLSGATQSRLQHEMPERSLWSRAQAPRCWVEQLWQRCPSGPGNFRERFSNFPRLNAHPSRRNHLGRPYHPIVTLASAAWLMAAPADAASPLDQILHRPAWQRRGSCRNATEEFFPVRGAPSEPAKAVCDRCTCRNACLVYALSDPSLTGVWGGTSERQRRQLRAGRS
jgi:hypothetical protein